MRKLFPILFIGISLLSVSQAHAELDDYDLGILTRKAWVCGNVLQGIKALQMEDHYPNFRARFLELATKRGATDWQRESLDAVFEVGIQSAIRDGYVEKYEIDKDIRENFKKEFDKKLYICDGVR